MKDELLNRALEGDRASIEALLSREQDWIHNVCRRMVMNPEDARDLTQEILLKIITNLAKYDSRIASLRTWIRKIAVNHILNSRRRPLEEQMPGLKGYGEELDSIENQVPDESLRADPAFALLVEEARLGCMAGMILCLDRAERIVFILGEIMGLKDFEAADILQIKPDAYRKRLSRARQSLYSFMNDKCGLINRNNPCRCEKKTRGFMSKGWVDPQKLVFVEQHRKNVMEYAGKNYTILDDFCEQGYSELSRSSPYWGTPRETMEKVLTTLGPD
jgi:RNA polymerase sigma factor (sigma-70 family)